MKITWSIPVWGESLDSTRGDIVRARHLIGALRSNGHKVHVVERTSSSDTGTAMTGTGLMVAGYRGVLRRLMPRPLALTLRDMSRYSNSRAFGRRVAAEARRHGADLIVETQMNCAASGAVAARLSGLPLIVDDCSPSSEEEEIGSGLPTLAHRILMAQASGAVRVIATSSSVRDRLVGEGVPEQKLCIVRNGVDLACFDRADGSAIRARLGLGGRCVIGFAGSFLDWHRVDLLVEALGRMPTGADAHLLLVGTGPNLSAVLDRAGQLGIANRVTSVGSVQPDEIPAYLAAFDVGVLPDTLDYGNPMKLTEYAAAALPAVGADRPSVREVVRHGETGLLVPPRDIDALATALARLAADAETRRAMGRRGRSEVAAKASWSVLANRLVENIEVRAAA
ncbi:glycosyltransferase family 4 protein [Tranquillimonas rosea]|uniref:glycosyltransferase family 4 protein n=1 Tax=Tranquillimonas rosea TaxID=641238 RepID=UPI003BACA1EA